MDLWNMAYDALPREAALATIDQKLAYANVPAILAVGQHLSSLNEGESTFRRPLRPCMIHGESDFHRAASARVLGWLARVCERPIESGTNHEVRSRQYGFRSRTNARCNRRPGAGSLQ
jgi:hypothetical protein